jgi:hypothetical protein
LNGNDTDFFIDIVGTATPNVEKKVLGSSVIMLRIPDEVGPVLAPAD